MGRHLVLESEEHAAARGAYVYAEAAGNGITADAHDIAQPDPAGRVRHVPSRWRCGRPDSRPRTSSTSTPTRRRRRKVTWLRRWRSALPWDAADDAIVTSTKSMTGHLLGAAGALESVATILAIRDRVVPPTINLDDPEDVGLDLSDEARTCRR